MRHLVADHHGLQTELGLWTPIGDRPPSRGGEEITLTRRGKPVAVLLSRREFARLQGQSVGFWKAYQAFRQQVELDRLGLGRDAVAELRDKTPGRNVKL